MLVYLQNALLLLRFHNQRAGKNRINPQSSRLGPHEKRNSSRLMTPATIIS